MSYGVNIGLSSGLLSVRHQAITGLNQYLFIVMEQNKIFFCQVNNFENTASNMAVILSWWRH